MNFKYKFLLTVVISVFGSAFASQTQITDNAPTLSRSQKQVVVVNQELLRTIMNKLVELNIKCEKFAIAAVEKKLSNINNEIRPLLDAVRLVSLPNGEQVIVKKQDLESAKMFDVNKFIQKNQEAIEEREKQTTENNGPLK